MRVLWMIKGYTHKGGQMTKLRVYSISLIFFPPNRAVRYGS